MKKILPLLFIAGLLFAACNPMGDIYDEIDAKEIIFKSNQEITLTDADYESMGGNVAKNHNFSASDPAAEYLPDFLADKYPAFTQGSIVNVTYKYYNGNLAYLSQLTKSVSYELTTADYDSMGQETGQPGKYNNFDASVRPENFLPAFFLTKYPSAKSGDMVLITYKFYSSGSTKNVSEFYRFNGSAWAAYVVELPAGITMYELLASDYDAMGAPGKYNNFSSTDLPGNYLPQMLAQKFPYVQEGTKIAVVYNYYSSSVSKRADEYTFLSGKWTIYNPVSIKTEQYIHAGTAGWVFDPSVVFTMISSDYLSIVNYVKTNKGASYLDSYGTAEFYYGASSYYSNFDLRAGKFYSGFSTGTEAVKEAIGKVLLPAKFPNAVNKVSGIDVNYIVSFAVYDGANYTSTMTFQCTKSGPNPEFSFVE
ncbi:MAG: hypothetical protein RBS73_16410 [Prolixibacteraceae bacterium]|jgi:uncharacterized protein (DUF3820 family)|nr:hypothetical protein [Prolixibacteraceae bacterium]